MHRVGHCDRHGNEIAYECEGLGFGRRRPIRIVIVCEWLFRGATIATAGDRGSWSGGSTVGEERR